MKALHIETPAENIDVLNRDLLAVTDVYQGSTVIYPIGGGLMITIPDGFTPETFQNVMIDAQMIDPARDTFQIKEV